MLATALRSTPYRCPAQANCYHFMNNDIINRDAASFCLASCCLSSLNNDKKQRPVYETVRSTILTDCIVIRVSAGRLGPASTVLTMRMHIAYAHPSRLR